MPILGELANIAYSKNHNTHANTESKHVYHVRAGGTFGAYTKNKTNKHTLSLRCCSSKCRAVFTVVCPFINESGETRNTRFKLRSDVPEEEFTDLANWGVVSHKCQPNCIRTPAGLCSKTKHSDQCTTSSLRVWWSDFRGRFFAWNL